MPLDESAVEREALQEFGLLPSPPPSKPHRNEPENWLAIDRALIKHFNFRPWELDSLTMTEMMVLFSSLRDQESEPHLQEAIAQAAAYRRLTPAQKLQIGMRLYPR